MPLLLDSSKRKFAEGWARLRRTISSVMTYRGWLRSLLVLAGGLGRDGCRRRRAFASALTVRVDGGELQGVVADDVLSFKGIPFAAPPVGRAAVAAAAAGGEVDRRAPGRGIRRELHAGTRLRAASGCGCARRCASGSGTAPTPPPAPRPAPPAPPPLRPPLRLRRRTACT